MSQSGKVGPMVEDPAATDALAEQLWQRLEAKLATLSPPVTPQVQGEQQAHAIIRSLGLELLGAANALQRIAETLKMQPNLTVQQRLQLANWTIQASSRARATAQSVLG